MNHNVYPMVAADELGWLTEQEMIEVDRVMVEDLRIDLIMMMEHAGRHLARLVVDLANPTTVIVYAGAGGNGGGGLVAARHLANMGVDVTVNLDRSADQLEGVAGRQHDIVRRMGLALTPRDHADVAIDALIGYSLRGAPVGTSAELIEQIPQTADVVVSLDTPSGLNVTTGETPGVAVRADATLTLALPKTGLRTAPEVGDLFLADIAVPPQVMRDLGKQPAPFTDSSILQIVR